MSKGKRQQAPSPTLPAEPSARYRFFCWAVAFLSAAQLLVGLDYITLWPGAETQYVWAATQQQAGGGVPALIVQSIPITSDYWLLAFRLPSIFSFALAVGLFLMWAPKLFGRATAQVTLLVVAASFLLPVMAKQATLDAWRLAPELGCWLALLYYLKTPTRQWMLRTGFLGALAVIVGGYSTLLMLLVWQVTYYRLLTPKHEELKVALVKPFVIAYLGFALYFGIAWLTGGLPMLSDFFAFSFPSLGQYRFLGYAMLGLLPFSGFMLAALRDLFYKMKRGEELSWLLAIGLLGSLLTLSLLFAFLLAFITAKQLENYFKSPNYPWQNWAKTGQVLHLVFSFMLIVVVLIGGFFQFQTDGFRAALGCCAAYWMFSFVGVIGLYGQRRDYVLGGLVFAGLLSLLFFWIQVYPFLHLQRNWPQRLTEQLKDAPQVGLDFTDEATLPLAPYLQRQGVSIINTDGDVAFTGQTVTRYIELSDSTQEHAIELIGRSGLTQVYRWTVE